MNDTADLDENDRLAAARLSAANQWLRDEVARLTAALAELRAAADQADAEYQAEIDRLTALVESLRREVREQRLEIAGLREERRAILDSDRPQMDSLDTGEK